MFRISCLARPRNDVCYFTTIGASKRKVSSPAMRPAAFAGSCLSEVSRVKVTKVEREHLSNFLKISKTIFRDTRVSWKARGFFATVMSLSPKWRYSIEGLAALTPGGRDAVYACFNELIETGYVKRTAIRKQNKIVEWEYIIDEFGGLNALLTEKAEIDESPINTLLTEKQDVGNQDVEKQEVADSPQENLKPKLITYSEGIGKLSDFEQQVWSKAEAKLQARINAISYRDWFAGLRLERIEGNTITLAADAYTADWLQRTYLKNLVEAFEAGGVADPEILWREI